MGTIFPGRRLAREVAGVLVGSLTAPMRAEGGQARARFNARTAVAADARNARDRRDAAELFAGQASGARSGVPVQRSAGPWGSAAR